MNLLMRGGARAERYQSASRRGDLGPCRSGSPDAVVGDLDLEPRAPTAHLHRRPRRPAACLTVLVSASAGAALGAVRVARRDVGRLIAITSAGVRDDDPELALWYRLLVRPLLRDIYSDMRLMEDTVRTSGLDWTLVRPVLLVDRDPTDTYRVRDDATPRRGRTITRTDLARFIVNEVDRPQWSRRTPTLAQ
ncbi:hypothetical protein Acsp06_51010 [Actinomycetospora sp. NBRC 106375]|nr:hypothetical protein Acsp06_51010 [Actinomycetospora sp. NBRC 106375]